MKCVILSFSTRSKSGRTGQRSFDLIVAFFTFTSIECGFSQSEFLDGYNKPFFAVVENIEKESILSSAIWDEK